MQKRVAVFGNGNVRNNVLEVMEAVTEAVMETAGSSGRREADRGR